MNYEDHDARSDALARAMQDTLSLERYPASYGAPGVAPAPNPMAARATGYELTFPSQELVVVLVRVTTACCGIRRMKSAGAETLEW